VHCRNCEVFQAAARTLLDREPPPGYGRDWPVRSAGAQAEERGATEPVLVFRVAREHFAVGVLWITEVAQWRVIRSVPHRRDDLLLGIANVSGELRICVSLEVLFGGPPPDLRAPRPTGRLLLVGRHGPEWAVPVDETLAIHRLSEGELTPAPSTVARSAQGFLRGMFPWRLHHVGLLDGELVLGAIARRLT
jgi:chemotaxis-related protein WspD